MSRVHENHTPISGHNLFLTTFYAVTLSVLSFEVSKSLKSLTAHVSSRLSGEELPHS